MSSGFKAFNINDLAISLNSVPLDGGGYGEDEVMSVEWEGDWFEKMRGADGELSRSNTNKFGAIVTLRYAQTADANDRLSALLKADILLPNGGGAGVFMSRDLQGRTMVTGPRAWVMGMPALKFGVKTQVNEWKIEIADARNSFVGGR